MHCNIVSFQELLDCFDNDLGNNLENNADNLEHNAEKLQEILNTIMQRIMSIITSALSYSHPFLLYMLDWNFRDYYMLYPSHPLHATTEFLKFAASSQLAQDNYRCIQWGAAYNVRTLVTDGGFVPLKLSGDASSLPT